MVAKESAGKPSARAPSSVDRPGVVERPEPMAALADVIRAAQRMIVARIDLATIQAKDTAQGAALFAVAAVVATFGWVLLMCGLVALLGDYLPTSAAFAIVGGAHLVAGVVVAVVARDRVRPGESTLSPADDDVH